MKQLLLLMEDHHGTFRNGENRSKVTNLLSNLKYMWQSDVELYRYMLCLFFRLNLWLNLEYTRRGNVCVYIGGKRNMTRIYKKWV